MPVVPTGDPAWVRTSDLTTYGGDINKHNHLGQGAIDGLTDVGAEAFSRMTADIAAALRTGPFLTLTYTCDDTTPAAPTVNVAAGMMGVRLTSYAGAAPPPGFPSVARNGNGDVTLTFATSYTDPYGISGAFVVQHPRGSLVGTAAGTVVCQILTGQTLRVRAFDASNTALSNAVICLTVHSGS